MKKACSLLPLLFFFFLGLGQQKVSERDYSSSISEQNSFRISCDLALLPPTPFKPNFRQPITKDDYLVGYAWNAYGGSVPLGAITVSIPSGTLTSISQSSQPFIAGADWAYNTWYGVQSSADGNCPLVTIDINTGTVTTIGGGAPQLTGLTFDVNTETMYTMDFNGKLFSINLTTGATTLVGNSGISGIIGIAANNEGVIYAISLSTDNLYTIDANTANASLVGSLSIDINYAQDIAFDRDNDMLYGTLYTESGGLYNIDLETGRAYLLNDFVSEVTGFAIPYSLALPNSPAEPTNFNVIAEANGGLSASLSWNNPTETYDGNELTNLTSVSLLLNDNPTPIYENNNPAIGANETYDFTTTTMGLHKFSVYGTNSSGNGSKAIKTIWIGEDTPAAPEDVTLTSIENGALVEWVAPESGLHGGYIDITNTVYNVIRMPGSIPVVENISSTEYIDLFEPMPGYYYYMIISHNNVGVGGTSTSNSALLGSERLLFYEDFTNINEGQIPTGWTVMGEGTENWGVANYNLSGGIAPEMVLEGEPAFSGSSMLVSPLVSTEDNTNLRLRFKQYLDGYYDSGNSIAVLLSVDNTEWESIWTHNITGAISQQEMVFSFDVPNDASQIRLGWQYSGNFEDITAWFIDDIIVEPIHENDLKATSISGNPTPTAGIPTEYIVTILNEGLQTQTNYSVKLMREGGIELTAMDGVSIDFEEAKQFNVSWTPTAEDEGEMNIYGEIVLLNDEFNGNNKTELFPINIYPEGTNAVTIGIGTELPVMRIPFDFFWRSSFSQTLYYANEINLEGGVLNSITYKNSFVSNLENKAIKIWVAETLQDNLLDGWYDFEEFSLVYEGSINFPNGENTINIPFQTPFLYNGGNLIVYTNHVWENDFSNMHDKFFGTPDELLRKRTFSLSADNDGISPENPGNGTAWHWFPNTTLLFNLQNLGALQGLVTDGGEPVADVSVSVLGTNLKSQTDEEGNYKFNALPEGNYSLRFEKFGFETVIKENIEVMSDQTTTLNTTLSPINTLTVKGLVKGNDEILLKGATVVLNGYDNYVTSVKADGTFLIEEVFEGDYDLNISIVNYASYYESDVIINNSAAENGVLDLGSYILDEILDAPNFMTVVLDPENPTQALLVWRTPSNFEDSFESGNFDAWGNFIQGNGTPGDGGYAYWFATTDSDGEIVPEGEYIARCDWGYNINTWLITPDILIEPNIGLTFSWYSSYYWSVNPKPNATLTIKISTDKGATWTTLWDWSEIGEWENFVWYETSVDLSDYEEQIVNIAIHLEGGDNAVTQIDNVIVGANVKSGTVSLTQPSDLNPILKSSPKGTKINRVPLGYNVFLDGALVNSTPLQDEEFLLTGLKTNTTYTAGVEKVYTTGNSEINQITFTTYEGTNVIENDSFNISSYPNPFDSSISFSNPETIKNVIISNMLGQYIKVVELNGESQINTELIHPGFYIVTVNGYNGEKSIFKMVKR